MPIWGLIRNLGYNSNKKRLLKNIDITNENAKMIARYKPSPIEAFFNGQPYPSKIAVSGGIVEYRARAISGAIIAAHNQKVPTVILHAGNKRLESMLSQQFGGSNYVCINSSNPIYDPLIGLANYEISKLIMTSVTNGCEIKSAGKYYIDGVTDFIKSNGVNPYINMYINCPHLTLFDKIDHAETTGRISAQVAQDIKSRLTQGQIERSNVECFFDALSHQCGGIFANKQNIAKAESVKKVVQRGGIIMIDVLSSANSQVINLISNEILTMLSSGPKLLFVIDSISVGTSQVLSKIVNTNFTNCGLLLSSEDIYSAFGGDEKLFKSFVGGASKYVVLSHVSATSAGMWSQIIGDYDKQEISINYINTSNYQTFSTILPGQTQGDTMGVQIKRENRVKPEEIMRMKQNEAYLYDSQNQEFAHFEIT